MKAERVLKLVLATAVTLGVVVGYWYWRAPESTFVKAGQAAPDLALPSLGGEGVGTKLSSFRGRPVLLVMFMAGCQICENEIWQVERLHREFLPKGLVVLGVAVDPDPEQTPEFVKRHQLTFIVLQDVNGAAVREAYRSWKMPEAYLIDAAGRVDAVYLGSVNWRGPEVRERIERLLPAPRATEQRR